MTAADTISCKPTPWFILRAWVMLGMFSVFAVLFYLDGSTGYRKKNETYYLHQSFEFAGKQFSKMNASGQLTPAEWTTYAAAQEVAFPADRSVLPVELKLPMPWPAVLQDYEKMKPLQSNILWREYSKEKGLDAKPVDHPFDAGKIREQWIVFVICIVLVAVAAFFLIRTMRRSISADETCITTQQGKRVPFSDLKVLDLRKWDTKGLAFIQYDGAAGKGRIRLDGLTYGGFKKEDDQPAEQLMQHIRARFSGQILEYAPVSACGDAAETSSEP